MCQQEFEYIYTDGNNKNVKYFTTLDFMESGIEKCINCHIEKMSITYANSNVQNIWNILSVQTYEYLYFLSQKSTCLNKSDMSYCVQYSIKILYNISLYIHFNMRIIIET